ncbi:hypothetical protein DPMN_176084 [Dreissena polymorpha]|uniref:Uncharacterized protein n=1 Tax=Dreissena polymorpha TaxID=45954 RepID=A0A9D4IGL7_DREPO|nr:hypothetical protein DPMN_176084 [Dreissena polymorpha]
MRATSDLLFSPTASKWKAQTILPDNQETRVTPPPPPPHGDHVFLPIRTIFELNCRIQITNVLTKFHEDWANNVSSRLFTYNCPPPVFSPIRTIFELVRDINETNVLTKNTAPPPCGYLHGDLASNVTSTVFTSFELSRGINGTNVLTKFHEDWTINGASRVLTRNKSSTKTIFKLIQYIIGKNLLTRFHDDRKINVTSRMLTRFY